MNRHRAALLVVALWALVVGGGFITRPAWPCDASFPPAREKPCDGPDFRRPIV